MKVDPAIAWIVALGVAAIFISSAALKLREIDIFESAVDNYRILPEFLVKPFAYVLPFIELVAAIAMIPPATRFAGSSALMVLIALFTTAIVINLARGRLDVDCGCFGPAIKQKLSWWLVARNVALMAVIAVSLMPVGIRPIEFLDWCTIGMGLVALLLIYLSVNYVFANMPKLRDLETRYA
jgi:hypothetical protein